MREHFGVDAAFSFLVFSHFLYVRYVVSSSLFKKSRRFITLTPPSLGYESPEGMMTYWRAGFRSSMH
jgi:hypothetical protein